MQMHGTLSHLIKPKMVESTGQNDCNCKVFLHSVQTQQPCYVHYSLCPYALEREDSEGNNMQDAVRLV